MKRFFAIAAVLLMAVSAGAQNYVNAGYGLCFNRTGFGKDVQKTGANALTVGYSHNFGIAGHFGVEPGLWYVYNFSKEGDSTLSSKNSHHGLALHVRPNYKFPVTSNLGIKLFVGPMFQFGLSDVTRTYVMGKEGLVIDNYAENDYSRVGLSASVGAAAELRKVIFRVNYDIGILDLNKGKNVTFRQNVLYFTLGYIF